MLATTGDDGHTRVWKIVPIIDQMGISTKSSEMSIDS